MRSFVFLFVLSCCSHASFHVDYATFLGGSVDEQPAGIAVDSAGNAYLVGTTTSPDFPLTSTAFGSAASGQSCAFVSKINPAGSGAVWSVCLGNSKGNAVALDANGNVYVLTNSSTVTKLTAGADKIVYSRTIAASATGLAADAAGNAYVVGSAVQGFPTTAGAYQPSLAPGTCYPRPTTPVPCSDAFVMKLAAEGSVAYATYLGGSGPDQANAIAVDSQGNAWITGQTVSPNFPVTLDALQTTFHGEIDLGPVQYGDAFVAKLDPTGRKLLYSTYLGGSAPDAGLAIAVDGAGAAYVGGATQSTDFPTTPGVVQRVYGGGDLIPSLAAGDAFVAKFNASGALAYSTYLGGPQYESAGVIAVDSQGDAYVTAFANTMSELSPDASKIVNSAGISGSLALDPQGGIYLTQASLGSVFFPSAGALQSTFGGGTYDVTLVKIDFTNARSVWIASILNAAGLRSGTPSYFPVFDVAPGEIISVFGSGFDSATRVLFDGIPATILYAANGQINAVVPFEVKGPATNITLQGAGQTFGPGTMNVLAAVPAIFTDDNSGKGQAAILNQDGSVNSASNPAARGSVISVFLTGAGRMTPPQADGSLGPMAPPFPATALGAGCNLGQVLYSGAAPGLIAGAVQVNVQLSQNTGTGSSVPVVIYIGDYASGFMGDTTVAVR
ncbi:MAG: SBBP repeat-containing protein [Candidatus Sulfopaludibacter sp.]|nr:SBBP repeat-containing protein [Candidatus Sulfopaludibacter sp.]